MYDDITLRLTKYETPDVDYLSETTPYFDIKGEHDYDGTKVVTGYLNRLNDVETGNLDGLRVTANSFQIKVSGSLCKWYLGNNFETLQRSDTQRAIEKISDTLHLPIDKAQITRIDVACNFIVKQPIGVYLTIWGN
jgi:hypothetical protein